MPTVLNVHKPWRCIHTITKKTKMQDIQDINYTFWFFIFLCRFCFFYTVFVQWHQKVKREISYSTHPCIISFNLWCRVYGDGMGCQSHARAEYNCLTFHHNFSLRYFVSKEMCMFGSNYYGIIFDVTIWEFEMAKWIHAKTLQFFSC